MAVCSILMYGGLKQVEKHLEMEIAEDINEIVRREVKLLKKEKVLDKEQAVKLEKYAKIYAVLMGSHRENLKYGILGKLSEADLEELAGEEESENDWSNRTQAYNPHKNLAD